MKNILSLVLIAFACFKLTMSFLNPDEAVTLFGAEVNVWVYRIIWLVAIVLFAYSIIRQQKKTIK